MIVPRDILLDFMDEYLEVDAIKDSTVNGLQVIGNDRVSKVALGVSPTRELFERAAQAHAEMVICHHGLLWEGSSITVGRLMKERLRVLFDHEINFVAYHLSLDKHPVVGNNAQISKRLNLKKLQPFGFYPKAGTTIGYEGELTKPVEFRKFLSIVDEVFQTKSRYFASGPKMVKRVAVISGGAASEVKEAIEKEADVYLCGQTEEFIPAYAKEGRINFIDAGHYNTEKFGVMALGELLKKKFGVNIEFIDIPNPI